jgi:hypothetical protein
MANPSNLYAEKIFSEHPIAMWALDDQVDYVSLISDSKRDIYRASPDVNAWTITNGTKIQNSAILNEPLPNTSTTTVKPIIGLAQINDITLTSSAIVSPALLNQSLETFSIGAYVYADNPTILSYEIGYTYDGLTSPVLRKFESQISGRWGLISETFTIPQTLNPIKIVIKISHVNIGGSPDDYKFYINGVTFGQWSEEFLATSSGNFGDSLPINVPFAYSAVAASSYGLQDLDGYYFINNNILTAKNSGVPIVYGSSNVTRILPNGNDPSLIIPGQGFLNESGRYREYTVEMWARIDSKATTATRIFGPIGSKDGIYVDGPFIKIKIGDVVGAHPITEWYRPMLLDFKVLENSASLLINGEQVIEISYSTKDISLPLKTITQSGVEKDNDWLGFYASENVPFLDIDCVAIYSYLVPAIVAKRRFAYGQAVEFPENANSAYGGTSVLIDYAFADYTSNYSYPDIGRWNQGIVENLSIVDDSLSVPDYKLPVATFQDNSTTNSWYSTLYQSAGQQTDPFLGFVNKQGYLLFNNMDVIKKDVKAFFGVFGIPSSFESGKQILFKIQDRSSSNYLEIYTESGILYYKLFFDGVATTLYSEEAVVLGKDLSVGIDLEKFSQYFGQQISTFFGNKNRLSFFVGGDRGFQNTFSGKIYKVGFSDERNLSKISSLFDEKGLLTYFDYENYFDDHLVGSIYDADEIPDPLPTDILDGGVVDSFGGFPFDTIKGFTASYTLIPKINFETISMDIAVDGYWEDYQPLTYYAQYVSDIQDNKYYDLDLIQFNIDYPALENFESGKYDTSENMVKSYISFQYLKTNSSAKSSYFKTVPADQNNVVSPGSYVVGTDATTNEDIYDDWVTYRYEVVDGTVIYPPKGVRFTDISIVTHLEWTVPGIISNPLIVKKMQYASQAFNEVSANPVGTRFGTPVFPYLKYGSYFDYKSRNPYRVYKSSTPYLYLTKNSGIERVGNYDEFVNRGFSIPVNKDLAESYKIIAMQAFLRYGRESFPSEPELIFEVEGKDAYIKFYVVANDITGKRARIYGLNAKTGRFENGLAFYWNGKLVREPVITLSDWGALGVSFSRTLDFDSYAGGIRFTGSVLVNNISQYQATSLQEIQRNTLRSWLLASAIVPGEPQDWDYWNQDFTWNGVLIAIQSNILGVDPSDIYKTYTGTNKIIIDDDIPLKINNYEYNAYQGITWQTRILRAV